MTEERQPVIWAFGGGVNSTAGIIRDVQDGNPIDAILFADTGGERPETLEHVAKFSCWLSMQGYPMIETVWYKRKDGTRETLLDRCLSQKMLPSLAYGYRKCSMRFKQDPQDRWVNNWQPAKDAWRSMRQVVKVIGYDADEPERVERAKSKMKMAASLGGGTERSRLSAAKYHYRYPLVEEWDMGRKECEALCLEVLGYVPPKSSCFFCPAMHVDEIIELMETHPDLLDLALAIEDGAELTDPQRGLGGSNRKWRPIVEGWQRQGSLFDLQVLRRRWTHEVPCGCYDG